MNMLGFLSYDIQCTFLQLYLCDKMSTKFNDELILSVVPALLGFLVHTTNIGNPITEYLIELGCRQPISFGKEIIWTILSYDDYYRSQAVFSHLYEELMNLNPHLRRQILKQLEIMDFIRNFMKDSNDPTTVQPHPNLDDK